MSFYRILNSKYRPRQNRNSSLVCFCSTDYRFHVDTLIIGEHFFINGHKRACMAIACGNRLFVCCIVYPVIVWIHYIMFVNRIIIACRKTSATSVDLNLNVCTKYHSFFYPYWDSILHMCRGYQYSSVSVYCTWTPIYRIPCLRRS